MIGEETDKVAVERLIAEPDTYKFPPTFKSPGVRKELGIERSTTPFVLTALI